VYAKYSAIVTQSLRNGPYANTSDIYAAPRVLEPGDQIGLESVVKSLRRAGYSTSPSNQLGRYAVRGDEIEVYPGPQSYFRADGASIHFKHGAVSELVTLPGRQKLAQYSLEPELITNVVAGEREKRRLVHFNEIPKSLVQAVVSVEDKRFFEHAGFDPLRIIKAAYVDLREHRKEQGASTLTMQLARGLYLEPQKRWRRKFSELMITTILEQRLSKEQIFELYANSVYLGRRDTFNINGFGEAAQAYFGTEIGRLTLPQAALIAGVIQRPTYFNPFRYPERATRRRNVVLRLMRDNQYITAQEYTTSVNAPLNLAPETAEAGDAPYFLALMNDELQSRLPDDDADSGLNQVYTTLDPDLQRAATEAVDMGIRKVDAIVRKKHLARDGALPQVALIALDPHNGAVKALVGGRNYAKSQLNHAIAKRQPGSIFKPFVYTAALNTALEGGPDVFTEATALIDVPTTFQFANQVYEPGNFKQEYMGLVTLREALAHSLNVATVSLAEQVGYGKVVAVAQRAGLNNQIQATPAAALGAYDATPMEMSGAYTIFANQGVFVKPTFVNQVRTAGGRVIVSGSPERRQALDPRVAYLMVDMLQEVLRSGTAAGVRSMGFKATAAGKTGTSHDGWFAGFTPDLLCVVWVGFDDNRELNIEGAHSALPIWAEFMKQAMAYYPGKRDFSSAPAGIVAAKIDPETGDLAGLYCPNPRTAYFISGSEPKVACALHVSPFTDLFPGSVAVNPPSAEGITSGNADRMVQPRSR
jgi:penicillin-binding protein 1B